MRRFLATALFASAVLFLSAVQAMAAPTVQVLGVKRMQPGWVRVYLRAGDAPKGAQYKLSLVCASPTDPKSVSSAQTTGGVLGIDVTVNPGWLQDNSLPRPCHISNLTLSMQAGGVVYADASLDVDIPMDLPLSLMTPGNTAMDAPPTPVPLAPTQTYAAYPPIVVAIKSATGLLGFAEVEELPERGTVGLRGLSVFSKSKLHHELGGGAEIPPGWGLDINVLGIWRAPQLPVETSHAGHETFPYSGTVWPPLLAPNPASLQVFPAPPLYTEADYKKHVLDNRGVHRCQVPTGCMDLTYNASGSASHTLDAANGATLALISPGPVVLRTQANRSRRLGSANLEPVALPAPVALPPARATQAAPGAATIANLDPRVSKRLLAAASALSHARTGSFDALVQMPTALSSSSAQTESSASTRDLEGVAESPEEESPTASPGAEGGHSVAPHSPGASCVINSASNGVTRTPSACNGMSASGFVCPTKDSPIAVEQIKTTTDRAAALVSTIPPYYAGRDNHFGTCATISQVQYVETLYDKYSDDLAIKRVIYVDGDPIVVPEPRVALTPTGFRVQNKTWDGTHAGDPPASGGKTPNPPKGSATMPNIPEAYWPAREGDWKRWVSTGGQEATPKCGSSYWPSAFCMGQGTAPEGVYRTHSNMIAGLNQNPLGDGPWSLANSYIGIVPTTLPLSDRDVAIQDVIEQIRLGLPVKLKFKSAPGKEHWLSYRAGPTWYIPPELGTCSKQALNAAFHPGSGHDVLIVGYWISGSPASPDLFNSYFIIENNWGKRAGYHSFFFMNFAAFKYLATGLQTFRLNRTCWSVACAAQPPVALPGPLLKQLLYPPDPQSPGAQTYSKIVDDARAQLGGVAGGAVIETPKTPQPGAKRKRARK